MKLKIFGILFLLCAWTSFVSGSIEKEATQYPQVHIKKNLLCDLELLLNGGFAPLEGFLSEEDYHGVLDDLRLCDGSLWPVPIVLPIEKERALELAKVGYITLIDDYSCPIAILDIDDVYEPSLEKECLAVYGSVDDNHPIIREILSRKNCLYVSGKLRKITLPHHFDFAEDRRTPEQTKAYFAENGWEKIVAFQTRNPMHRCHMAIIEHCVKELGEDGKILLHPIVGTTQPGDVRPNTRVKCYKKLIKHYPEDQILLSLLPLSMRMAGPREALWHAIIRKNYGCTHFIVGRDHAGPSVKKKNGEPFFGPYDAHDLLDKYKEEVGIEILKTSEIVYDTNLEKYVPRAQVTDPEAIARISGTQFRKMLQTNQEIPEWFSYPEVIDLLKKEYVNSKGVCIFFTGLSASGKTALSQGLKDYLHATQDRNAIVLDGDVIRKYLSNKLGFSKEDRSINVRRNGFVASLIVDAGGISICANIAPYEEDRAANRELISQVGTYIEVFVDTPLAVCEDRDPKGLYKAARAGIIPNFTEISDPYEAPTKAEIVINSSHDLEATLNELVDKLKEVAPQLF